MTTNRKPYSNRIHARAYQEDYQIIKSGLLNAIRSLEIKMGKPVNFKNIEIKASILSQDKNIAWINIRTKRELYSHRIEMQRPEGELLYFLNEATKEARQQGYKIQRE